METPKEKKPRFRIEKLEDRIAPAPLAPFAPLNVNPGQANAHAHDAQGGFPGGALGHANSNGTANWFGKAAGKP